MLQADFFKNFKYMTLEKRRSKLIKNKLTMAKEREREKKKLYIILEKSLH